MRRILFLYLGLSLAFISADEISDNVLLKAASDELQRNIKNLRIEKQEQPYYISYQINEDEEIEIKAEFGGILYSNYDKNRKVFVDIRVGDYHFDNSNFVCKTRSSQIIESDHTNLPLENDYDAIRHALWIVTDGTYKKALAKFSRKKATLQNQPRKEDIPDNTKVTMKKIIEPVATLEISIPYWTETIKEISQIFQDYPKIQESNVVFHTQVGNKYFLDTEGDVSRTAQTLAFIEIEAKTQSKNGDPIEDRLGFFGHNSKQLPEKSIVLARVKAFAETLSLKSDLEKTEDYSGPVLFIGQAAAELFFQILGKGISDPKTPLFENEMLSRGAGKKDMGMLTKRIGRRVMSDFISAYDDPTLANWQEVPLIGHYLVDDEGTNAEKVLVAEDGRLLNVLMGRAPIKKIKQSNGHARYREETYGARTCGMVANLIIDSREQYSQQELKDLLLEICDDFESSYGIIVTRLQTTKPLTLKDRYMHYFSGVTGGGGAETPILSSPTIAYKIDVETGQTDLIRGLDFASITPRILRDIVATGDEHYIYNFLHRDIEGNVYPMSVITPAVLIEEVDMETREVKPKKLPILEHPNFQ
jgi:TldD protein